MGRFFSILGLGFLFCWTILIALPSPHIHILADTPIENAQLSFISSLSIGLTLLIFSPFQKRLYGFLVSKGVVLFGCLFVVSNVALTLAAFMAEGNILFMGLPLALAGFAAAALIVFSFCFYGNYSGKEITLYLPFSLFVGVALSLATSFLGEFAPLVLLAISLLEGIWLFVTLRRPEDRARIRHLSKAGERQYVALADVRGKAFFTFSLCVLCFSFFLVFGYNSMVALYAGVGGVHSIILTIVICALATGILVMLQKRLGRRLLLRDLFGPAITVQGLLIMIVEPLGVSLIPYAAAVSTAMLIVVLTGISNLSQHFAMIGVYSRIVSLSVLFVPVVIGLVVGASFAVVYMDSLIHSALTRIVLLCILFCPFAFLAVRVLEVENHFFFAIAAKNGNGSENGSYSPSIQTTARNPAANGDISTDGESLSSDKGEHQNGSSLSTEKAICELAEAFSLTGREKEIADYLVRGRDIVFISNDLFLSKNTVSTHIRHIYQKLNIHSKQELITIVEEMVQGEPLES